jgi:hypothetical protein
MHQPQSFLMWVVMTLGINSLLIPLCAAVSFGLTILLLVRGKGPSVGPALLFIVPMPLLLSLAGALKGSIASFAVLAMSDVTLKSSEVAAGVSEALLGPMMGLLMMAPSYLAAVIGLLIRSLQAERR